MLMTTSTLTPNPTLTIRTATESDYAEIGRITVDAYIDAGHFDDREHPYLQFVQEVAKRHETTEILVAEREGIVIGAVTMVRAGTEYADIARENELEFRMLVIDPVVQRSGAGRALLRAVIDRAREIEDVDTVSLTTGGHWMAARALYEVEGFDHVTERDWFVPDTDIVLVVYTLTL
ncbi:GNAT family N-acetyltransferase [Paeniglutamicibacter cryotolerans]